ncbi:MAG: tetratricopeptide repeat protein [Muribaculaceae bacterium]|nr:tetratricopeptide repeat protein [Muribaculaceae bacterium]
MDVATNITQTIAEIRRLLNSKTFNRAFQLLRKIVTQKPQFAKEVDAIEAQYFYMLRFIASDNEVSNLSETLNGIIKQIDDLLHRIEIAIEAETGSTIFGGLLRYAALRPEETLESLISDYIAEQDRLKTDTLVLTDTKQRATIERISNDIFNRLWIEYPVTDDTAKLIAAMISDEAVPVYDRALWINAIGLALLKYPIDNYFEILLQAHRNDEAKISTLAAIWTVIAANNWQQSVQLQCDSYVKRLIEAQPDDFALISREWCRTLATDSTPDYFSGINPDLRKIGREFKDKLRNIDPKNIDDLVNSDWLSDNINSEGFDSIKRFVEAQKNGEDVFMSTLGKMRHFDFFYSMPNWFLPFHTAHSALATVVDSEGAAMADTIAMMPSLCDSDKYALLLSMAQSPSQVNSAAFSSMSHQIYMMMNSDEAQEMIKQSSEVSRVTLINNHMKNLYRFFKLYKARNELNSPFSEVPPILFLHGIMNVDIYCEIADILYQSKRYTDTACVYGLLSYVTGLSKVQLYKYAASLYTVGDISGAIDIYRSILREEPGDYFATISLARSLITINQPDEALDVMLPIESEQCDNIDYLKILAVCYSKLHRWGDAMEVYLNIEYLLPENDNSVNGDLAWAATIIGEYSSALEYFNKASDSIRTKRRFAIMKWLTGRREEALTDIEATLKDDDIDKPIEELIDPGFTDLGAKNVESLNLINDILRYRRNGSVFGNIL